MAAKFVRLQEGSRANEGYQVDSDDLTFASLFRQFPSHVSALDWGFPHGQRQERETDQACALRHCYDLSGLPPYEYQIFLHVKPFQEKILTIDQRRYCQNYYLAQLKSNVAYQSSHPAVKIRWMTESELEAIWRTQQPVRWKMFQDIISLTNKLTQRQRHNEE